MNDPQDPNSQPAVPSNGSVVQPENQTGASPVSNPNQLGATVVPPAQATPVVPVTPPATQPVAPPPVAVPETPPAAPPAIPPTATAPVQPTPPPAISPLESLNLTTNPTETEEAPSSGSQVTAFLGAAAAGFFNWVVVPAGIVLVLHFFVFQAFHVVGYSMIPTLDQADYLIIDKLDASLARVAKLVGKSGNYYPKRGEIIVFHYPKDPSLVFVKRTIALPGDHIIVKDGKVTLINKDHPQGINPDATHLVADPVTLGDVDEIVPNGNIFVMGDNRTPNGSFDSRDWGDLPTNMIIGKAVLRLLPLNRFHPFGTGS